MVSYSIQDGAIFHRTFLTFSLNEWMGVSFWKKLLSNMYCTWLWIHDICPHKQKKQRAMLASDILIKLWICPWPDFWMPAFSLSLSLFFFGSVLTDETLTMSEEILGWKLQMLSVCGDSSITIHSRWLSTKGKLLKHTSVATSKMLSPHCTSFTLQHFGASSSEHNVF